MSWISGNYYLTEEQMQNNAEELYSILSPHGWSLNAVAAILGNAETESTINPGIWQDLTVGTGGYGLVQWTPYTKYSNWAGAGWENNGDKEVERLEWEFSNNEQYFKTNAYPLTAEQFKTSHYSPEYLAYAFMYNYERPANKNQPQRQTDARKWYDYLSGKEPEPPEPPEPDPPVPETYIPAWLLFKFNGGTI